MRRWREDLKEILLVLISMNVKIIMVDVITIASMVSEVDIALVKLVTNWQKMGRVARVSDFVVKKEMLQVSNAKTVLILENLCGIISWDKRMTPIMQI